jgi:NAD(P)-dependent dehydrogenase (short-subunit alcohol dehydrogenase family)
MRLEGKTCIVTGGAVGIGRAIAERLVAEGANVCIADIDVPAAEKAAAELSAKANRTVAMAVRCNVVKRSDIKAAIAKTVEQFGRLDVMFNNAGFGGVSGSILDTDMTAYDTTMAVLLRGVILGMKHAGRVMKEQGSGSIISTSSVAGVGIGFGPHVYSAAKAAVIHLTKSVANELGESGVRVNAICPGGIATPIFGKGMGLSAEQADLTIDLMKVRLAQGQPIKRSGLPEDIANAAAWLASDEASFVNGHALVVDGGITTGRLWSERQQAAGERMAQFKLPGNQ